MAKRNNRVRSSVVGDEVEINRLLDGEFNPVKTENERKKISAYDFLYSFVEYFANDERQPGECINSFLDNFDDPRVETQEPQPEQPEVKTTAAYDNSRLEFLRMQIGPVQSFYQTLGNILFSLSMRLDVAEAKMSFMETILSEQRTKIENLKAHADQLNLERALYKRYGQYCEENKLQWSSEGFVTFIREYAEEEESENSPV